jgi:hypothetical protein
MRDTLEQRLAELRQELETGQVELAKLERQRTYLHDTTLRISGAVQVLEELLATVPISTEEDPFMGLQGDGARATATTPSA